MSKKSFARLIRIVTGTFGTAKDEFFSLETSLTRFETFVHFWVLVVRSFIRNRCPVRASALSYTTLLALIPMLAVAMSVSSVLLRSTGKDQISTFIDGFIAYVVPDEVPETNSMIGDIEFDFATPVAPEPVPAGTTNAVAASESDSGTDAPAASIIRDARVVAAKDRAAGQIRHFIQNAYSGTLGTVGALLLFWTAIAMLVRVEETFNDIWGVTRGRDWTARISNYLTTLLMGPVLLTAALGLASGPHFQQTRQMLEKVPFLAPIVSQLVPVMIISITFALVYKLMPNTRVHFGAALVGGLLAGTAWHIFNLVTLYLGSRAVTASRIYGSLALLPLMMVGLYAVWVIVLFGAQVAYAFQNRESYLQERIAENVNQRGREFVALRLMTSIGQRFDRGLPPASVAKLSHELGIPSKLVQQVLQTLLAARLVVEVAGPEAGFSPARALDTITCHHILLAMRATQGQDLLTREEPVREEVLGEFARIQAAEKTAAESVSLLGLVHRARARLELQSPAAEPPPADRSPAPVVVIEAPAAAEPARPPEPEPILTTNNPISAIEPGPVTAGAAAPVEEDERTFPL